MKTHRGGCFAATWICLGLSMVGLPLHPPALARAEAGALSSRRHYRVDRARSRITIETRSSSLLTSATRVHLLAAREFQGQVSLIPGMMETTVVDFAARADSLTILDEMSEPSRRDIDLAIRRVLDATRYPHIAFHSSKASADPIGPDVYDVAASGMLDLHGVRRPLTVSAQVSTQGDVLRIRGACTLRQTDYGLVPFSLGKGAINVEDDVTLTFDLVATAAPGRE